MTFIAVIILVILLVNLFFTVLHLVLLRTILYSIQVLSNFLGGKNERKSTNDKNQELSKK